MGSGSAGSRRTTHQCRTRPNSSDRRRYASTVDPVTSSGSVQTERSASSGRTAPVGAARAIIAFSVRNTLQRQTPRQGDERRAIDRSVRHDGQQIDPYGTTSGRGAAEEHVGSIHGDVATVSPSSGYGAESRATVDQPPHPVCTRQRAGRPADRTGPRSCSHGSIQRDTDGASTVGSSTCE